jgi:outer membrane protein W
MPPAHRRCTIAALSIVALLVAAPASAQIVQSVQIGGGMFFPRGFDSRNDADTLVADLTIDPTLAFDVDWFRNYQIFGEWNLQTGNHLEFSVGVGFYRSTDIFSHYRFPVDGLLAGQVLRLRIIPVTAVVRFFPFGSVHTVQPFVGAGLGMFSWTYSESGAFLDPSDNTVFSDEFRAHGDTAGHVALFGVRVPAGTHAFNFEWRYQSGLGKTGGLAAGFLGDRIDLGGGTIMIGFVGRF